MPSIRMNTEDAITDQSGIWAATKAYYENLYTSKEQLITAINLEDIIPGDVSKLTNEETDVLEGVITEVEALRALRALKLVS